MRQLTVDVIDVNDVSPRFDRPFYVADLRENNAVGAFVVQLNATDADSGASGRIVYGMDDDGGVFEVDPDTGAVTARASLDREVRSRYRLRVRAVDGGRPTPRSATAVVVVNVVDVDDERPRFVAAAYSFSVAENQPPGTEVGRLSAVDADLPSHGRFYFRLRGASDEEDDGAEAFEMDQRSGAIVTTRPLDREHRALYVLATEVREVEPDNDDRPVSAHPLNSTAAISVRVLDVNDNHPVFVSPQPEVDSETGTSSIAVSNVARRGRVVTRLKAVDADDADNALVTYTIVAGNERQLFSVDAHSGDIVVNEDLTGDRDNQVRAEIFMQRLNDYRWHQICLLLLCPSCANRLL